MTRTYGAAMAAAVVVAATACATSAYLLQPPGSTASTGPNAPINQTELPGIVAYENSGTDAHIATLRADAYKKMTDACHGPYRIENEGPELLEGGKNANAEWIIHFMCVAADSSAPPHA